MPFSPLQVVKVLGGCRLGARESEALSAFSTSITEQPAIEQIITVNPQSPWEQRRDSHLFIIMSKATSSPTARLLQSSRLFSLPRPLPQPVNDTLTSTGIHRHSDTATLPYPTHQAIATPASSLHRGDFGLKRSLPKKALKTSTPYVRVRAQDTYEHITDFASAADLTLSERKFREMGVPLLMRAKKTEGRGRSVFDSDLDNTDPEARAQEVVQRGSSSALGGMAQVAPPKPMQRWKYRGPWIVGMAEGEFDMWLQRNIGRRKEEWKEFVRQRKTEERVADAQREAREAQNPLSKDAIAALQESLRPTDAELESILRDIRNAHARDKLSSELTLLLTAFLDLPALSPSAPMAANGQRNAAYFNDLITATERGPPTTHPAAGLSHLRTHAVMSNHPIWGPQSGPNPIEARVVTPRDSAARPSNRLALLGVGGFVAEDPNTATFDSNAARVARTSRMSEPERMAKELDTEIEGGNKIWVQAESGIVDEKGRVRMSVKRADPEALAVKRGGEELERIIESKKASVGLPGADRYRRGPFGNAYGL